MSLWEVDFDELFRRHLCRHGQFGINVLHLVAVVGIYVSLVCIALTLSGGLWITGAAFFGYFALLAANLPLRLWLATLAAISAIAAVAVALPTVSVWMHVALIVVWHKFQIWNHHIFKHSHAMDDFADKYHKGLLLFTLLSLYELPILLQFLLFRGGAGAMELPTGAAGDQA